MTTDAPFPDFQTLDAACAEHLGWSPRDVDRHSFYDVWTMLGGARRREEREWERVLYQVQATINWGGPRGPNFKPKPLDDLYRRMFGRTRGARPEMTHSQIRAALSAAVTVIVDAPR